MATINTVVQAMVDWIKAQPLIPVPREVVSTDALPPAAFPRVAVVVLEERQSGPPGSFLATLAVSVSHAPGRPADAQATTHDLAHQLCRAFNRSHDLCGVVKWLRVAGIRHSTELLGAGEPRILARSELLVETGYDEPVV